MEEAVFGPHWEKSTCTVTQAKAYFRVRFGLGHTSFYEILRPRLRVHSLAPEHLGSKVSSGACSLLMRWLRLVMS